MAYENAKKMIKKAYQEGYAVGHFNMIDLIWAKTILVTCQEKNSPVIIGASEGAIKFMGGYNVAANVIKSLVVDLKLTIPVALHLDHGSCYEACEKAIVAGFSSVMLDKSSLPLAENIRETQRVVELAAKYDVSVEAEIGFIGGEEEGVVNEVLYAKVEDCVQFNKEVKVDMFAPALGSVHGHYKGKPKLGFKQMEEINRLVKVPLVLHGASGLPDELVKKAIARGIAKVNTSTDAMDSYNRGLHEFYQNHLDELEKGYDPRKHIRYGNKFMREAILKKIELFGSANKA